MARESHLDKAAPEALKSRAKFIIISVLGHVIFLSAAWYFVVQNISARKQTFVPPAVASNETKDRIDHTVQLAEKRQNMSAPADAKRITTTGISPLTLPDLPISPTVEADPLRSFESTSLAGRGSAIGFGSLTNGQSLAQHAVPFFGLQVSAKKLGVLLDVSLSTHAVIGLAVQEIQKSFPKAVIVLVPGCGMNPSYKGTVYSATKFTRDKKKLRLQGSPLQIVNFMFGGKSNGRGGLLRKNADFNKLYDQASRENRVSVLAITSGNNGDPAVLGTQIAFDFLFDQGVDAIYWFADFRDSIDEDTAATVIRRLKAKKIRVYQHVLIDSRPISDATLADRTEFSRQTDGKVIKTRLEAN